MSFKITIELDGHTEQELMPAIRQVARRYPELFSGEGTSPDEGLYVENPALLQQQIQQLMIQNRLLQAQLAGGQQALPPAAEATMLPQGESTAPRHSQTTAHTRPHSQQPILPARYRTRKRTRSLYRLKQAADTMATHSWRLLVWVCFGQEWLLIFLLLSGALFGALAVVPMLEQQLLLRSPEFVESSGQGPGAVSSTGQPEEQAKEQPKATPNPPQSPETTPPADPASKAGSHPPPPPAFQTQP